jgi:hypothetical protein
VEETDPALAVRIASPVAGWQERSNGLVEARAFGLARRLDAGRLSTAVLRSLGLESVGDAGAAGVRAVRLTPAQAFNRLFSAACSGGAYPSGLGGAYSRLAAWRSVAGLAGAPEGEGVDAVAERAGRCAWVSFHAASGWFYDIAWDLGILALRPDGRSIAVLAATDTD